MKTIKPIGPHKEDILVDDDDFERFGEIPWKIIKRGTYKYRYYALTTSPTRYLHRLIMNAKKGQVIDHIDGNSLNNQKYNLRFCTASQNNWNRSGWTNRLSKYKGVSKDKKYWMARLCYKKKKIYLGNYKNEIDAAKAYDKKAIELFKEFALLNFK